MATGRTVFKHSRVYLDQHVDLDNYTRSFGPFVYEFEEIDTTAPHNDAVKGYLPGQVNATPTVYNGIMEGTGFFGTYLDPSKQTATPYNSVVIIALGIGAAPAEGDPCFMGRFHRKSLTYVDDGGLVTHSIDFGGWYAPNRTIFNIPWGVLAHESSTETAVNSAAGIDQGGATALGGYMVYSVSTANGTATIKMQDAAVNNDGGFADITGLTTGVTDFTTAANCYGVVASSAAQAVRQYVRWQIVLGTANTINFTLGFARRYSAGQ